MGIEPALKPAAAQSHTGVVGVMATRGTLNSEKFRLLLQSLHGQATFVLQPCDGLADAIERDDEARVASLCADYLQAMGRFGTDAGAMDTLVLGCTHYPFVGDLLRQITGNQVRQIEGGIPVARQTRRVLEQAGLLKVALEVAVLDMPAGKQATFFSSGHPKVLETVVRRWLGLEIHARPVQ